MANTSAVFQQFSNFVYRWANEATTRWPLSDWYYTDSPTAVGFRARSVIGGFWMKVLMDHFAADPTDGITDVNNNGNENANQNEAYDLTGRRLDASHLSRGLRIVRQADGTFRKVLVK